MATTDYFISKQPTKKHRARKVITRSRQTVRTILRSAAHGHEIHGESKLERDWHLQGIFSRAIKKLEEQPARFRIPSSEGGFWYYPDGRVTWIDGSISYYEIKSERELCKPEVRARLRDVYEFFRAQKISFETLTEKHIRHPVLLANLRLLYGFRRGDATFYRELCSRVPATLSTLENLCTHVGDQAAMSMVAWQLVFCDLLKPLTLQSSIRHMRGDDHAKLF